MKKGLILENCSESELIKAIRHKAIDLLSRREHTQTELRNKLARHDYAAELVDDVIAQLALERLQSDERFAEAYVYQRVNKGYGPLRIKAELKQRGVDADCIAQQMDDLSMDWYQQAAQVLAKRFRTARADELTPKEKSKYLRFLQTRGFESGAAFYAIEQLGSDVTE